MTYLKIGRTESKAPHRLRDAEGFEIALVACDVEQAFMVEGSHPFSTFRLVHGPVPCLAGLRKEAERWVERVGLAIRIVVVGGQKVAFCVARSIGTSQCDVYVASIGRALGLGVAEPIAAIVRAVIGA